MKHAPGICCRQRISEQMASVAFPHAPAVSMPGWLPGMGARLALGVGTIIATSMIVFAATQALPSDPARVILGPEATEAAVVTLRGQLGLDRPLMVQYLSWAAGALRGDFGASLDSGISVAELVVQRSGASLALGFWVLLLALPLSFAAGTWLAQRADSRLDRAGLVGLIVLKAVPAFVLAILLVLLLAIGPVRLLPAVSLLDPARPALLQFSYVALPVLTLLLSVCSPHTRG